jgi:hypothetical protein
VAAELFDAGQAFVEGFVGGEDGGAFVAFLLMQGAADDLQRAFPGEVEEPSGQRGDADIDVAGHRGGGDRLGRLKEAEGQIDALVAEITTLPRDVERRWGQGVEQAEPNRFAGPGGGGEEEGGEEDGPGDFWRHGVDLSHGRGRDARRGATGRRESSAWYRQAAWCVIQAIRSGNEWLLAEDTRPNERQSRESEQAEHDLMKMMVA